MPAPKSTAPKKESPQEVKAAPAKPAKTVSWIMLKNGTCEGAQSGRTYKYSAGDLIEAPEGDLDYLGSRYAKKHIPGT